MSWYVVTFTKNFSYFNGIGYSGILFMARIRELNTVPTDHNFLMLPSNIGSKKENITISVSRIWFRILLANR
jgi:hypothetical protein